MFRKRVKAVADGGTRETAGKRELRRRVSFQEVTKAVSGLLARKREDLLKERGGHGRPLAMWAARRYAGLTLREIGEEMEGRDYAAIGMALKRFETRLGSDRNLRRLQKQLTAMLNVET